MSNPTSFRLTFRSKDNKSFPAKVDASYIDSIQNESNYIGSGTVPIPTHYRAKTKQAIQNPVAVVREYQRMVNNLLTILVGIHPDNLYRKSVYYKQKQKGVFGHIFAMHGVHETQQRGALHTDE